MVISRSSIRTVSLILAIVIFVWAGIGLADKYGAILTLSPEAEKTTVSNFTIEETQTSTSALADSSGRLSEYRLERARVRSKEISLLQQIAGSVDSPAQAKQAAYSKLVTLVDRDEKELQAEALVKAQGCSDCAVIISDTATMVLISANDTNGLGQDSIRKSVSAAVGVADKAVAVLQVSPE